MRFYKIDTIGKMWLQRLSLPVWAAADEGRLLYDTVSRDMFLGDNGDFRRLWSEENDGPTSGLSAQYLGGQDGTFYLNASNLNAGIVHADRLSGTYNINITGDITGDISGDIFADNGTTQVLENSVAGAGAWFMGDIRSENSGVCLQGGASPAAATFAGTSTKAKYA